jgi:hypothetical protein
VFLKARTATPTTAEAIAPRAHALLYGHDLGHEIAVPKGSGTGGVGCSVLSARVTRPGHVDAAVYSPLRRFSAELHLHSPLFHLSSAGRLMRCCATAPPPFSLGTAGPKQRACGPEALDSGGNAFAPRGLASKRSTRPKGERQIIG